MIVKARGTIPIPAAIDYNAVLREPPGVPS